MATQDTPPRAPVRDSYDVVVVGGGAAGLSGALTLARARRSVLVVDAGSPRNAPADGVHNYLGREGMPPGELLAQGRREVEGYGGQVLAGTAAGVDRLDDDPHGHRFRVHLDDGRSVTCRRLLVTTGLVDQLPDIPGLAERWGRDVLHCPFCHGREVGGHAVGILATSPVAMHQALMWRSWTDDVTLLRHPTLELADEQAEQLAARGIAVVDGEVSGLDVTDNALSGVRLADGRVVALQALVVFAPVAARDGILTDLGLRAVDLEVNGTVMGTRVPTGPAGATEVPGVRVAGSLAEPMSQVIAAAASGLVAAAATVGDFVAEETAAAVAAHHVRQQEQQQVPSNVEQVPAQVVSAAAAGVTVDAAVNADLVVEDTSEAVQHAARNACPDWDERYTATGQVWSGRPNGSLVDEVTGLPPGRALDVGCGEGADAVWLARQGWQVTALDVSQVALDRGAHVACDAGVQVQWLHAGLLDAALPQPSFDLVSVQYPALPRTPRSEAERALLAAVAPGGTLLVVHHADVDPEHALAMGFDPDDYVGHQDMVAVLDDHWEVQVDERRPRNTSAGGGAHHTHDLVLRARRRL